MNDKEDEIARLKKVVRSLEEKSEEYRNFLKAFNNEPTELSHDKLPIQYSHWKRHAGKLVYELEKDAGDAA
jgi:hypothetical protein